MLEGRPNNIDQSIELGFIFLSIDRGGNGRRVNLIGMLFNQSTI